jgi:hypothetical protein
MEYPDGTSVNVGDHIWWNEGTSIGFVRTIVESKDDVKAWGLDEPHILISGYHPTDPDDAGYVAYSPSDFADEGIGRLTPDEEEMLAQAVAEVRSHSRFRQPFLVGVICRDCQAKALTFSTFDGSKTEEFARVNLLEKDAEQAAAPNRSATPILKSEISVRGSEG